MEAELVYLRHLFLILVLLFQDTVVGENSFACFKDTVRPQNGLPFYEIISKEMSYSDAQETCRQKGAELLTNKMQNRTIIPSPESVWLSARRSNWKHVSLPIGLVFSAPSGFPGDCLFVSSTTQLDRARMEFPDIESKSVICMNEEIVFCDGYDFDHRCYFHPEDDPKVMSFENGKHSCQNKAAHMVAIYSQEQIDWLVETFRCSFWTGYCYDENNKDYYWPDGSVVLNANLTEGDTSSEACAIINRYGEWERSSCDIEHTAVCSLDVPYAVQNNVSCKRFEEECVCYWQHDNKASFNDAMATCMSEGGILFYPNNEEKLAYHEQENYWIGVSQGLTRGVFRGSDSSVIEWAEWKQYPRALEKDCVSIKNQMFSTEICEVELPHICQSRPDPELYPCNESRGCLGAYDFWNIEQTNLVYMGPPEIVVRNVNSFEECWEICVNYIGFVCLIVTYNITSEDCQLFKGVSGHWRFETTHDLLSRNRTRTIMDPDSYCLISMETKADYTSAIRTCEGFGLGWKVPVIRDDVMQKKFAEIRNESWLSAKMNPVGVFSTSEGEYIPYSKLSPFQLGEKGNEICATSDGESWYIRKCDDEYNIVCFANFENVCVEYPTITHGTVLSYVNMTVDYICDENYFLPGLNVTSYRVQCTCDWTLKLDAVRNCTAIECPEPRNSTNGTVTEVTGLRINDTVTYQCLEGFKVKGTDLIYYNRTCELTSRTTADWSASPGLEAIECTEPINSTAGTIIHITGFRINDTVLYECPTGYIVSQSHLSVYNLTCTLTPNKTMAMWTDHPEIIGQSSNR